jgi:hypothetical protein
LSRKLLKCGIGQIFMETGTTEQRMNSKLLLALLLVVWNCAGAQSAQENQELMNAALRLKQAAVLRTLEDCKAKGGSVKSCNTLLELTHQRELKVIERLKLASTDPTVNMDEVSKESAACYDYGYVELVECWSQLSDRLDAARKGQSLLRNAGPARTVAGTPPVTPTSTPSQNRSWAVTNAELCEQGVAPACLIADLEKRIDFRIFGENGKYELVQGGEYLFSTTTTPTIMKRAACYYFSETWISPDFEKYTRLTGMRAVDRDRFQVCWQQK